MHNKSKLSEKESKLSEKEDFIFFLFCAILIEIIFYTAVRMYMPRIFVYGGGLVYPKENVFFLLLFFPWILFFLQYSVSDKKPSMRSVWMGFAVLIVLSFFFNEFVWLWFWKLETSLFVWTLYSVLVFFTGALLDSDKNAVKKRVFRIINNIFTIYVGFCIIGFLLPIYLILLIFSEKERVMVKKKR